MNTLALISHSYDMSSFRAPLLAANPALDIAVWPDPRCLDAEVAVCWAPPPGVFQQMPNLRLVHAVAAGVDNLLAGQDLGGTPVCRVVDPQLADGMEEFVRWAVTLYHREIDLVLANQSQKIWKRPVQRHAGEFRVGVMGLGQLGGRIAATLARDGYQVAGWSRSLQSIADVETFAGPEQLKSFAARSDALIVLLPLTDQTRGILDAGLFAAMPRGAALIHVGRGPHLVPADLIAALESGHLRGALLDVFEREPLSRDDPLWTTRGVIVTPHMASMAAHATVGRQVAENIRRLQAGHDLLNAVDIARGY